MGLLLDLDIGRGCGLCRDILCREDSCLAAIAINLRGGGGKKEKRWQCVLYSEVPL